MQPGIKNIMATTSQVEEQNAKLEKANKELEKANQKLELMKIELERSNEDLRQFASMASHDLKAPLRNINSFIGLIRRKVKKYDDKNIGEYLDFVSTSAVHMSQLIEDILEYARIGNEKLPFSEVKLENLIIKTEYNLKRTLADRNATIQCQPLPVVIGNPTQLGLLFQNLIENGIKYNTNETPTIEVSYQETDEFHFILFKDNGIGIKEEFHIQIFEMFKRLHTSNEYKGSGIGLATCHRIMERHQGQIKIESQENQGSTFIIELPKHLEITNK